MAIKLTEGDLVSTGPQLGNNPSTATVNWKNVVLRTVRDKEARLPVRDTFDKEARRKCNHLIEEITIDQSKRDCIGCTVREPALLARVLSCCDRYRADILSRWC